MKARAAESFGINEDNPLGVWALLLCWRNKQELKQITGRHVCAADARISDEYVLALSSVASIHTAVHLFAQSIPHIPSFFCSIKSFK